MTLDEFKKKATAPTDIALSQIKESEMKFKCHAYISYEEDPIHKIWNEVDLPSEPFSSIDNCWQWMKRTWPNAQIRLEWTYNGK